MPPGATTRFPLRFSGAYFSGAGSARLEAGAAASKAPAPPDDSTRRTPCSCSAHPQSQVHCTAGQKLVGTDARDGGALALGLGACKPAHLPRRVESAARAGPPRAGMPPGGGIMFVGPVLAAAAEEHAALAVDEEEAGATAAPLPARRRGRAPDPAVLLQAVATKAPRLPRAGHASLVAVVVAPEPSGNQVCNAARRRRRRVQRHCVLPATRKPAVGNIGHVCARIVLPSQRHLSRDSSKSGLSFGPLRGHAGAGVPPRATTPPLLGPTSATSPHRAQRASVAGLSPRGRLAPVRRAPPRHLGTPRVRAFHAVCMGRSTSLPASRHHSSAADAPSGTAAPSSRWPRAHRRLPKTQRP